MKDNLLFEDVGAHYSDDDRIKRGNAALRVLFPPVVGLRSTDYTPESTPPPIQAPRKRQGFYSGGGKRLLDLVLILVSLPMTLTVVGICALALWIEGGNPFYRQDRLGLGGRRFSIIKLRTMVRDADGMLERCLEADPALRAEWNTTQKLKRDPRITVVGAILRATSLDELPQFWNVFRGDMSLVGPRPMLPEQLPMYGDPSCYFALRPGITGFWQVSARNENHFSFRGEIDCQYQRRLSLWCDLGVMLRTVSVMIRRTGY